MPVFIKGASINTAPYQSRISIATGFFRRRLISPQALPVYNSV